jgi:phosphoribosylaminoimidazole carboxylase (NCAIR synthetase)
MFVVILQARNQNILWLKWNFIRKSSRICNLPSIDDIRKARAIALQVSEKFNHVGLLAVEMFQTENDIIVNEVAPRPHNSGHYSIEGSYTSQFENHLRAINLPLGNTDSKVAELWLT